MPGKFENFLTPPHLCQDLMNALFSQHPPPLRDVIYEWFLITIQLLLMNLQLTLKNQLKEGFLTTVFAQLRHCTDILPNDLVFETWLKYRTFGNSTLLQFKFRPSPVFKSPLNKFNYDRSFILKLVTCLVHFSYYFFPNFAQKTKRIASIDKIQHKFMLTLFSGCLFPGVRCQGSSDLCLIARETTRDSWTWVCI